MEEQEEKERQMEKVCPLIYSTCNTLPTIFYPPLSHSLFLSLSLLTESPRGSDKTETGAARGSRRACNHKRKEENSRTSRRRRIPAPVDG